MVADSPSDEKEGDDSEAVDFVSILSEELTRTQERHGFTTKSDAFVFWSIRQISPSLDENDALAAVSHAGSGEQGIDAAWYDGNMHDRRLSRKGVYFIAQGKCPDDLSEIVSYGPQAAKDLRAALTWLRASAERTGKSEVRAIRRQFQDLVVDARHSCKFGVLVAGVAKDSLKQQIENLNLELREEGPEVVSFELYDLDRLWSLYVSRLESSDLQPPSEVTFNIPLGYYEKKDQEGKKALVTEVPLSEIYRIYNEHGLALFAKNLRVPIASSRYNQGIENTLGDPDERRQFWFYNNGLTAICDAYGVGARSTDPENLTSVVASGFQIVNGCQTCATIHKVGSDWKKLKRPLEVLNEITVPFRLIKIGDGGALHGEMASKIARYTNSQTPITPRDLHANDPEQGRIRDVLSRDWTYFFEVKKGEWQRRGESDRDFKLNYDPPGYFTNEKAGQAFVAFWQNEPTVAKSGKRQIFENERRYRSIFGYGNPVEALLLPTQMLYLLGEWRKKRGIKLRNTSGRKRLAVTRPEVLKHGDLYVLSIVGDSLKRLWGYADPAKADPRILRIPCKNLKDLIPEYRKPRRGRQQHLARELEGAYENALEALYTFCKERCAKDPELTVRNLLVRPSTWKELEGAMAGPIERAAKGLRPVLDAPA